MEQRFSFSQEKPKQGHACHCKRDPLQQIYSPLIFTNRIVFTSLSLIKVTW